MILVVSHPGDDHAAAVVAECAASGGRTLVVDTSRFPTSLSVTQRFGDGAPSFAIDLDEARVDLGECHVAWWRRPQAFDLDARLDPDSASFAYTECFEALAGLWNALPLTWVNPPVLDERAHHKPYQLAVASDLGLTIPQTVITNDVDEARKAVDRWGEDRTVYKTFLASEEHWRETRVLRSCELALLDRVQLAPVIFQEFVPARADIRATVVGDRIFAAEITTGPDAYEIDYRMNMEAATFLPTELPPSLERAIQSFMQRIGIVYGAIDLRHTPAGEYVFLEVNPAGEWLFVEERTGQPITRAVADLLLELDRTGAREWARG